ncbi:ZPR1 zinc finger domain-containing protein [Candidatus Woesearchaeota archaeon]|nr:MAG: ZPR1 zinc finger domain-containing protein [Candidatus Woesearchaeota archaeon]
MVDKPPEVIHGETCPFCNTPNLTLMENESDIPYFGKVYLFSMTCSNCKYHKADVEVQENKGPVKWEIDVSGEDELNIRVVKSASATVKIPRIITIEAGEASNGYVTNIEGLLNRIKKQIEFAMEDTDDPAAKKKAKKHLRKIQDAMWGHDTLTIQIEDKTGNSAIISDKAKKK